MSAGGAASRALSMLVLILAALFHRGGEARAHATLVTTHPQDGAVLRQAPASIQLRFNEGVTPLVVRLLDASGRARDVEARSRGDTVEITPPADPGEGTLTLSWRVISADGHPVGGALTFSLGAASAGATAPTANAPRAVAIWAARALFLAGLLAGVGGALVAARIAPERLPAGPRTGLHAILAAAASAAIVTTGLQGLDMLDAGWSGLFDPRAWRAAVLSPQGATSAIALVAFACAAMSLATNICRRGLALAALLAAGAALAASGHAGTASPQWLTRPSVFLHVVSVTILLAPLPFLVAAGAFRVVKISPITGSFALAALALLVASGVALAVVQIATPAALVETPYGLILVGKVALALGASGVVVAARRSRRRAPGANSRKHALVELTLAAGVVMLTAGWRLTPPPRAFASPTRTLHIHTADMMAMLAFDPGRAGPNRLRLDILDGDFAPVTPIEVRVTLRAPDGEIEPLVRAATRGADGDWLVDRFQVPFAGRWTVEVEALVTDFDRKDISADFDFPP